MSASPLAHLYPKARPRARGVRILGPILRKLLALRARVCYSPFSHRTIETRVAGVSLAILPGVFNPAAFLVSPLLVNALDALGVGEGIRCLELGAGCGLAAIHAARRGAIVTAVDINPAAVACTRKNAVRNGVENRITALESDLFSALEGERYNLVLFHPPYFPGAQSPGFGQAWHYGDLPERFARGLAAHLLPSGSALLLLSSNGDCAAYLAALEAHGFQFEIALERDLVVELAVVYRVWRPQ